MNPTLSSDKSFKQRPVPFSFQAPAAREVSLAGNFNYWDPHAMPMHKGTDGMWHLNVTLKPGRHAWVQIGEGEVTLNGQTLTAGDGAAISDESALALATVKPSQVLLFDLN